MGGNTDRQISRKKPVSQQVIVIEGARVELRKERAGVEVCVILSGAINTPQFDRARQKLGLQPPVAPIYQPELATMGLLAARPGRFPTRKRT